MRFSRLHLPLMVVLLCGILVLWGCTEKRPPAGKYEVVETFNTGPANVVRAIKSGGSFTWVGTSTGIMKINSSSGDLIDTYTKESGLSTGAIFSANISPSGLVWFGTDAGGLLRFDGKDWKTYGTMDGLSDPWVYDIRFHPSGEMWVATWDGVSRYDPSAPEKARFTTYGVSDGLVNKWVYGMAIDLDGTLWFGTEEGANRYDPRADEGKQWSTYTHKDGLGAPNKLALARKETQGEILERVIKDSGIELAPDRSYAGHFHDLGVLDPEGNETYNENYIFAIEVDSRGVKWFGTWGGGVSRYDGRTWTNYTTEEGLAGNIVYALAMDGSGGIWAGTNHGVSRFNGKTWESYTRADGLLNEDVYAITVDAQQKVWIGQKGGVIILAKPRDTAEKG